MDAAEGCIVQMRTALVGWLVAILVVAALPVGRAAMDRPTWSAGDFWEYRFTGAGYEGTLRMDVTGTADVVAGDTTYSAYAVKAVMSANYQGSTANVTLDMWHRTTDLAIVKQFYTVVSEQYQVSMRTTYDPPLEIRWPLVPGTTWSATSTVRIETQVPWGGWTNYTTSATSNYEVLAETELTVPAGTFTAYGLRGTGGGMFTGSAGVEYWSPAVGNAVRIAPEGGSAPTLDLTEYHHVAMSWPWTLVTIAAIVLPIALVGALLLRAMRRPAPPASMPPQTSSPGPPTREPVPPPPLQPPGT